MQGVACEHVMVPCAHDRYELWRSHREQTSFWQVPTHHPTRARQDFKLVDSDFSPREVSLTFVWSREQSNLRPPPAAKPHTISSQTLDRHHQPNLIPSAAKPQTATTSQTSYHQQPDLRPPPLARPHTISSQTSYRHHQPNLTPSTARRQTTTTSQTSYHQQPNLRPPPPAKPHTINSQTSDHHHQPNLTTPAKPHTTIKQPSPHTPNPTHPATYTRLHTPSSLTRRPLFGRHADGGREAGRRKGEADTALF